MTKSSCKNSPISFFIDLIFMVLALCLPYLFKYFSFDESLFYQFIAIAGKRYSHIFLLWMISLVIFFKIKGLYLKDREYSAAEELFTVLWGVFYTAVLTGTAIFFLKYQFFSREIFIKNCILLVVGLCGWRAVKGLIIKKVKAGRLQYINTVAAYAERIDNIISKITEVLIINNKNRVIKALTTDRIDRIVRCFLYLMIMVLPFSKAGVEICFGGALFFWIIKWLFMRRFELQDSILNKPIFVFIFAGIFSVIGSIYFRDSLYAFFAKFMEGILLYFIVVDVIRQKKHLYIIIGLFLCAAFVVCIDGFIQKFFTGTDLFRKMPITRGGITAAFNHKNDLGAYLLFPLLITWSLIQNKLYITGKRSKKTFFFVSFALFCLFIIAMGLTSSTGAWFGLIIGILVSIFVLKRKIYLSLIIPLLLVFILLALSYETRLEESKFEAVDIPTVVIGRVEIWKDVLSLIKDRPFFGYGINTFMKFFFLKYFNRGVTYAHNCYLQMAAEMGVIGLLCFLWIIGRLFKSGLRLLRHFTPRNDDDRQLKFLLTGLLCGLLAFLLHSFVDTHLYSLQLNALFWYTMGLTVCVMRLLQSTMQGQ